jgi:hypothetical protein
MFSMHGMHDGAEILKNGMFSDNTAKHFSQRANKYITIGHSTMKSLSIPGQF